MVLAMASGMALSLAACGGSNASDTETTASAAIVNGGISVFYYTYGDTYISSVRSELDAALETAGIAYQDYDSDNSQSIQAGQIADAISEGTSLLAVNLVDNGSDDAARDIIAQAGAQGIPVIFFNRPVSEKVVSSYDKCVFVGTDYELAGHMQGEMIGDYLMENFDKTDLNGDGQISYVMFKGQEGNAEAAARTQFSVEDADKLLKMADRAPLSFYDGSNTKLYLADPEGLWSAEAANRYMQTILSQYNVGNKNMVELVIANNDEMALGAVRALQSAGFNLEDGSAAVIPVFGVDATDAAKEAIDKGTMTGTIRQDAEGMASTIVRLTDNYRNGADTFADVEESTVVGTWRVNIPYTTYTGEE